MPPEKCSVGLGRLLLKASDRSPATLPGSWSLIECFDAISDFQKKSLWCQRTTNPAGGRRVPPGACGPAPPAATGTPSVPSAAVNSAGTRSATAWWSGSKPARSSSTHDVQDGQVPLVLGTVGWATPVRGWVVEACDGRPSRATHWCAKCGFHNTAQDFRGPIRCEVTAASGPVDVPAERTDAARPKENRTPTPASRR